MADSGDRGNGKNDKNDNIEIEVRSFISPRQYEELTGFFKSNGKFLGEDYQVSYYFSGENDLRIQKNNSFAKIWLKKGKIHDDYREEIEIRFDRNGFEKMEAALVALGYTIEVKWFRRRTDFEWEGIKVSLDFTEGYGYIIELEKMGSEGEKKEIFEELKLKMNELGIEMTPKEVFDERFDYYKKNWKKILSIG